MWVGGWVGGWVGKWAGGWVSGWVGSCVHCPQHRHLQRFCNALQHTAERLLTQQHGLSQACLSQVVLAAAQEAGAEEVLTSSPA